MKKTRQIISVFLCMIMLFTCLGANAEAYYDESETKNEYVSPFNKTMLDFADKLIDSAVTAINFFTPTPKSWVKESDYSAACFMKGIEDYSGQGSYWSIGYDSQSLLTGNELDGNHYVGGSLSVSKKTATEVWDDLKVRTIAMSDNSGNGIVVFAVLDAYGLASSEVQTIRKSLEDFCNENNVVSLNISVMHQHSAIDTFGMNGDILTALGNTFRSDPVSGINDEYQENMRAVVASSIKNAVSSLTKGKLYYGTADFSDYVTDKRDPVKLQTNFDRFRFVPDDGSRETWFTTSCIHCVGNGAGQREITGDYPYYMDEYINSEYNANFIMMLGAEQATSQDKTAVYEEGMTTTEELNAYGKALAQRFASIDNEKEVSPYLNVKHKEVFVDISNQILVFAGKYGLLTNTVVKSGVNKYKVATEIGYMEIGDNISVVLIPGEIAAELIYGGTLSADESWTGEEWSLPSVQSVVGDRTLIVFGLINDQIGYIIPDNDYMSVVAPNTCSLELVSTGKHTASTIISELNELINE